jgi:hypothetical protein
MFVLGFELAHASLAPSKGLATKLTHCGRPSNIETFLFYLFYCFHHSPSCSIQAGVGSNIHSGHSSAEAEFCRAVLHHRATGNVSLYPARNIEVTPSLVFSGLALSSAYKSGLWP